MTDHGEPLDELGGTVTAPPTGGPGRWPTGSIPVEARDALQDLIRETPPPVPREIVRIALALVVMLMIVLGSLAWRDLDGRIEDQQQEIEQLRAEIRALQAP